MLEKLEQNRMVQQYEILSFMTKNGVFSHFRQSVDAIFEVVSVDKTIV